MKSGDYMIHVYVQQAHSFKLDGSKTVNPLVEITCCDETKYTSSREDIPIDSKNPVMWREHIFFEPKSMRPEQISTQTIKIKLKNKGVLRDELIGSIDYDITSIYFKDRHTIEHQWMALSNPDSVNFTEIAGILRCSISVLAEGDKQVQLQDPNELDLDSSQQKLMIPPTIKMEYRQLKIRFLMAEHLPKLDTLGSIDAFIQLEFGGKKYATQTVNQANQRCPINFEFWIPLQWPLSTDRLVLKVYDFDTGKQNEIVGSLCFSLADLCKRASRAEGLWSWINIYGSPVDSSGSEALLMDNNPEKASTWKGRILMQIECATSTQPESRQQPLDPSFNKIAIEKQLLGQTFQYQVIAEVGLGVMLPGEQKFTVRVCIGEQSYNFEPPKVSKNSYNRWHHRLAEARLKTAYSSVEMIGRVYIYLMRDSVPIGYWWANATEFVDPSPQYRWCIMKADKAIGSLKHDHEAGMIQLKLSINDVAKNGEINFSTQRAWARQPPKRLKNVTKIRCFIFQCKNLPSSDDDGLTDCFISLWNQDGEKIQTRKVEDSLNPLFYETKELYCEFDTFDDAPPIILNFWDYNFFSDTFIGRAIIKLQDASANEVPRDGFGGQLRAEIAASIPKPKWHSIRLCNDEKGPDVGQVLCSFIIAPSDQVFAQPASSIRLDSSIPKKDYLISINVFGLRQLQSFGLMPIRKPFVKFHIKSLLPPERAGAISNIQTVPTAGANPNINTLLSFSANLPAEALYCPLLACEVFDYVFLGLSQPLIGTFEINIGEIKDISQQQEQQKLENIKQVIAQLREYLAKTNQQLELEYNARLFKERGPELHMLIQERKKYIVGATNPSLHSIPTEPKDRPESRLRQSPLGYQMQKDEENPAVPIQTNSKSQEKIEEKRNQIMFMERALLKQIQQIEEEERSKSQLSISIQKQNPMMDNMKKALKAQLLAKKKQLNEELKQLHIKERIADQEAMRETGNYKDAVIKLPKYFYNQHVGIFEEVEMPPASLFMKIGYNNLVNIRKIMLGNDGERRQNLENIAADEQRLKSFTKMHYRKYYEDELENCKSIFQTPVFQTLPIKKGVSRGVLPLVDQSGNYQNLTKQVGLFKGLIQVVNKEEADQYLDAKQKLLGQLFELTVKVYSKHFEKPFPYNHKMLHDQVESAKFWSELDQTYLDTKILKNLLQDVEWANIIQKRLQSKENCLVKLYILQGIDLSSRDIGSFSDPYIKVTCGENVFSERNNYQLNQPSPQINKMFRFNASFPGSPSIMIEAFDYDDLFGDDLIGKTFIEMDDRFFNPNWQKLRDKPIEFRQIYHHSSALSQGQLSMWLEIEQIVKKNDFGKEWTLESEPAQFQQIRVVVFETENIPVEDVEGTSDVYIKAYIDRKQKQQTDCHYRCMNGRASFNYRMLFDVSTPRDDCTLVLQAWDRDLFKCNDYLVEWTIDLKKLLNLVRDSQQQIGITKNFYNSNSKYFPDGLDIQFESDDSFWVTVKKDGKDIKLRLDIKILPEQMAKAAPVGAARSEPNLDPYLMPPVGRIEFTANPLKMLDQLISPQFKRQILKWLILLVCTGLFIYIIPSLIGSLGAQLLLYMFS